MMTVRPDLAAWSARCVSMSLGDIRRVTVAVTVQRKFRG
jgi:hypothetical protein